MLIFRYVGYPRLFSVVDQTQTHQFFLQQNVYYEDAFNSNQIQYLSQFFIDNPICIFYGNAIVGQTILQLFHPSRLLAVYSDKWFLYELDFMFYKIVRIDI